ncbi:MAG: DUF3261 domain-containing protein [bacterium]|nr:DUF3261 domain-containing protein [bacterium]
MKLLASGQVPGNFALRQRLRFRAADGTSGALEAVLQVHCGALVIVGLSPLGQRLFSITQRGYETQVQSFTTQPWPFAPDRVLLDVHRTYLYPVADPPLADGSHTVFLGSFAFVERWQDGRLVERTIPDRLGARMGSVVVSYKGGVAPREVPRRVHLRNGLHDYEIEVETLSRRELICPS